ncbi:MAG: hypothetical protein ABGX47_01880 [Martelella sp.]
MRFLRIVVMMLIGATAASAADWRDAAVAEIAKEKQVVEVMFSQPISLWALMYDDGSRRDGYAEYLCLVLFSSGMPKGESVIITIWDATAMVQGDMKRIGRFECDRR